MKTTWSVIIFILLPVFLPVYPHPDLVNGFPNAATGEAVDLSELIGNSSANRVIILNNTSYVIGSPICSVTNIYIIVNNTVQATVVIKTRKVFVNSANITFNGRGLLRLIVEANTSFTNDTISINGCEIRSNKKKISLRNSTFTLKGASVYGTMLVIQNYSAITVDHGSMVNMNIGALNARAICVTNIYVKFNYTNIAVINGTIVFPDTTQKPFLNMSYTPSYNGGGVDLTIENNVVNGTERLLIDIGSLYLTWLMMLFPMVNSMNTTPDYFIKR